jgi:hypothetical protein
VAVSQDGVKREKHMNDEIEEMHEKPDILTRKRITEKYNAVETYDWNAVIGEARDGTADDTGIYDQEMN